MVLTRTNALIIPTTGHDPPKQDCFQDDAKAIPPAKRGKCRVGVISPEVSQQLQGVADALFRNHDALRVVVPDLESGHETTEVSAVHEHRNIVSLE